MKKLLFTLSTITFLFGCQKESLKNTSELQNQNLLKSAESKLCYLKYRVCIKQLVGKGCNPLLGLQHKNFVASLPNGGGTIQIGSIDGFDVASGSPKCFDVMLPKGIDLNFYINSGCAGTNFCPFELTITALGCPSSGILSVPSQILIVKDYTFSNLLKLKHCMECKAYPDPLKE